MTDDDPETQAPFVLGLSSKEKASLVCFRCREGLRAVKEVGQSNAGTAQQQRCCGGVKEYTLPCGCRSHYDCLAAYIQYQINNRNFLRPTEQQQGVISCPYGQACSAVDDLLTLSDIEQIVAQSPCDSPLALDFVKLRGWLAASEEEAQRLLAESDSEKARRASELDPFVVATTKACPTCSFRSSHYHGHHCHHIAPAKWSKGGSGCPNCHINYCYKCLSTEFQNLKERGDPTKCECGYWGNFCAPIRCAKDIELYIETKPVPYDKRCGCVICPDCLFNQPCDACTGNCVVCLGFVNPGTRDLTEHYEVTPGSYFAQSEAVTNRLLLQEACLHGDVEACLRCLDKRRNEPGFGFSINMQDHDGQTLMHFAVSAGHFDIVSLLLEQCHELDVNIPDEEGYNPFMIACKDGYTELVKLLAQSGRVNVNLTSSYGYTPLFVSSCNGHVDVVQFLLSYPFFNPPIDVNQADHTGYVPLLIASRNGHVAVVKLLLEQKSCDIIHASRYGSTALFWAEKNKHHEVVKAIKAKLTTTKAILGKIKSTVVGCTNV